MLQLSAMPDDLKHRHFMGFSPDTPPAAAAECFRLRHACEPAFVITVPNALFVGPLPQPAPRQMTLAEVA